MAYSLLPSSFDTIKSYLISQVTSRYPSLGGFINNSMFVIIIDVIAWALALFMDYSDNLFNENHLFSAVRYENARKIAAFYGYDAARKKSATGYIKVGIDSDFDTLPLENVTFEKYDGMTINGIDYVVSTDTTFSSNILDDAYASLPTGELYALVPVLQGQLVTVNQAAAGTQNEAISISDATVENTILDVYVNGTEWTAVDSFFVSESTDAHYTSENLANMAGIKVTFGDGFKGLRLTAGDAIIINYISTSASNGQIQSTGFPVTFSVDYQYSDLTSVDPYGENSTQMINASEIEGIDSIQHFGKISASSLSSKAFNNDEVVLELQAYGGILKSKALSEYDISPDTPDFTLANIVKLLIVTTSGEDLDDSDKQSIRNFLRPKMDFTDFIQFIDVEILDIMFVLDLEVFASAPTDLSSQIDTYLQTTYALGELDFGESLNHSPLVFNIQSNFNDYIKRFNTTLKITETSTNPAFQTDGSVTYTLALGSLVAGRDNIKSLTIVAVFNDGEDKNETLVSDTSGVISSSTTGISDLIDSGTVDLETGVVILDLQIDVDSITTLEYRYETYDRDGIEENIDIRYDQILRYGKSSIETETVE